MNSRLYHAVSCDNFSGMLATNSIRGYSTHRLHRNGTVPWERSYKKDGSYSKAYLESEWHFGICLTRSRRFALGWNDVVLEFDRNALKSRYRIRPYNWSTSKLKAELEEFLITSSAGFTCQDALLECLPPAEEGDDTEQREILEQEIRTRKQLLCEGFKGEVTHLHRYVKSVTLVETEAFKSSAIKLAPASMKAHQEWKASKIQKTYSLALDWCDEHSIPLMRI